jgi:transposase
LTVDQRAELRAMVNSPEVSAAVATRARIVLWRAEGRQKQEVAALAGVSRPTVGLWLRRFEAAGAAGLLDRARGAAREQVPARIRARILAATKSGPPAQTGLSHWSSREMARFITRTQSVYVSHHYVAKLWRETRIKPHQSGHVQGQQGPRVRREGRRRGRSLPRPARRRGGALDRGENPDPSPGSKPWTGPRRCCRSSPTRPRNAPTTTSDTARRTCSPP